MNELVPGKPVSTRELRAQGITAIGGIAGGALLLVLGALPPAAGIIAGAVVGVAGLTGLFSRDREDRAPGLLISAAGVLGILARAPIPLVRPFAGLALAAGAAGLFALGIWKGIRFFRGLKSRS